MPAGQRKRPHTASTQPLSLHFDRLGSKGTVYLRWHQDSAGTYPPCQRRWREALAAFALRQVARSSAPAPRPHSPCPYIDRLSKGTVYLRWHQDSAGTYPPCQDARSLRFALRQVARSSAPAPRPHSPCPYILTDWEARGRCISGGTRTALAPTRLANDARASSAFALRQVARRSAPAPRPHSPCPYITETSSSSNLCRVFREAPLPFLRIMSISAAILRAISSGVSAPRSKPMGA